MSRFHRFLIWLFIVVAVLLVVTLIIFPLLRAPDVAQVVSTVEGTILRGPTCPVMREPPDPNCADQPVQGTFIVTDVAGTYEYGTFETDESGHFVIELPSGEYAIKSTEPIGISIQTYRIEALAGTTTEYTISFDTGIR